MPATPSFTQSRREPQTYRLRDGRTVELRNGCLVDSETRHTLAGSNKSTAYLLANAKLTADERAWLTEWGDVTFDAMSVSRARKDGG